MAVLPCLCVAARALSSYLPHLPLAAHAGVLASLPKMTPQALDQFRQSLRTTGSEKVQRDLTKKMLVRGGWAGVWAGCLCWVAG